MKRSISFPFTAPIAATVALLTGGYLVTSAQDVGPRTEPLPGSAPAAAQATAPTARAAPLALAELAREAELVFLGDVIAIRYVQSQQAGQGRTALPHTFVSYRVRSVLHGDPGGPVVTLRFLGGFDPLRGEYLRTSVSPQFDLGDRDLLFVQGNGRSMCPLVRNSEGRLRVIRDQVYDEMGHEVLLGPDGALHLGRRFFLEEVRTTSVQGRLQELDLGPEAVEGPSNAVPIEELLRRLAALPRGPQDALTAFASADPSIPFVGPDFTPAGPPRDRADAVPLTPEELEELVRAATPDRQVVRTRTQRAERPSETPKQEEDRDG